MDAVEFITELNGKSVLDLPQEVAERLPKTGRARVIMLMADDTDESDWQQGAYAQFLRDDSPEDSVYDSLK